VDNSKIVFLLNESVTAVKAVYEPGEDMLSKTATPKVYTFKSFDPSVKVGDLAVVETNTRFGFTVVKIIEVDVDVDFDSPIELKWLVQRLDTASHEAMLKSEAEAIAAVNAAEKRRKRDELRATMFKDHEAKIASLSITHQGEEVITPPSAPDAS